MAYRISLCLRWTLASPVMRILVMLSNASSDPPRRSFAVRQRNYAAIFQPHHFDQSAWIRAMMLPSVSLNHAAFAPPAVEIPLLSMVGISYFSNLTPRAVNSATSFSMSLTCQNPWLACDVPAFGVGYRKQAVPLANS